MIISRSLGRACYDIVQLRGISGREKPGNPEGKKSNANSSPGRALRYRFEQVVHRMRISPFTPRSAGLFMERWPLHIASSATRRPPERGETDFRLRGSPASACTTVQAS